MDTNPSDFSSHQAYAAVVSLLRALEAGDVEAAKVLCESERSALEWRAIAEQAILLLFDHIAYMRSDLIFDITAPLRVALERAESESLKSYLDM
jgi:hypothetical protein